MKFLRDIVNSFFRKKGSLEKVEKPLLLYHGSHSKHHSLKLPDTEDTARMADGHAVYMSDKKEEANSYGKHLHHVEFHVHHENLMDMDAEMKHQTKTVQKGLKTLDRTFYLTGKSPYDKKAKANAQDFYMHLAKTHGHKKTTQMLLNHGIHGGFGVSSYNTGKKRANGRAIWADSRVYSSYAPERHLRIVHHEEHSNA